MTIGKKKDGRYYTTIKRPDGKRKYIYGKTKTEVREKYEAALVEFKTKPFIESNKMGLKDWFDHWCEVYTANLRPRTLDDYKHYFRAYVIPYFGNKPLQKITHAECQQFINELSKKMKPSTLGNEINRLSRVMQDAVKEGIILNNPVKGIVRPPIPEGKIQVIEPENIRLFLNTAERVTPDYADIYEFLLLSGLRIGELLGLTIDNYNKENKTLLIEKQYVIFNGTKEFTPTKTGKSRTIILTERASEIVEERIKKTLRFRESCPSFNPNNFIFVQNNNKNYNAVTTRKKLKKVCRECSLPEYKLHDLRHTYATLALALSGDVKSVQKNLGHTSAKMTLDIYATSTTDMNEKLNNKIDDFWDSL